jgi:hypothetical protein
MTPSSELSWAIFLLLFHCSCLLAAVYLHYFVNELLCFFVAWELKILSSTSPPTTNFLLGVAIFGFSKMWCLVIEHVTYFYCGQGRNVRPVPHPGHWGYYCTSSAERVCSAVELRNEGLTSIWKHKSVFRPNRNRYLEQVTGSVKQQETTDFGRWVRINFDIDTFNQFINFMLAVRGVRKCRSLISSLNVYRICTKIWCTSRNR